MKQQDRLRFLAVVLALISAVIHLALSVSNLIPGEETVGPLFASMGVGYIIGSVLIFLRKEIYYWLVMLYSVGLIFAYAASRDTLPVEPIGLLTKADEVVLILSLFLLTRWKAS